jgi:hypothetical protein
MARFCRASRPPSCPLFGGLAAALASNRRRQLMTRKTSAKQLSAIPTECLDLPRSRESEIQAMPTGFWQVLEQELLQTPKKANSENPISSCEFREQSGQWKRGHACNCRSKFKLKHCENCGSEARLFAPCPSQLPRVRAPRSIVDPRREVQRAFD